MFRPAPLANQSLQMEPVLEIVRSASASATVVSRARLIYVGRGRLTVESAGSRWLVRRDRAMWVPAGASVHLTADDAAKIVTVYIPHTVDRPIGPVVVSALLRAVLQKLMVVSSQEPRHFRTERHLLAVLADELVHLPDEPTLVPIPSDERLRALATRLQSPDGLHMTLQTCSRDVGLSARTLSRLIHQQTGLSFGRWRRRLHLAVAMSQLSAGEPVNSVAYAIGYDSPSAFIAMFRRAFGMTPLRYVEQLKGRDGRTKSTRRNLSTISLPLLIPEGWGWLALFAG